MENISSIINDFNSAKEAFDFNYGILVTSVDSLKKFTDDNISLIMFATNEPVPLSLTKPVGWYPTEFVTSSSLDDSDSIRRFYFKEWHNANKLALKIESNVDTMRTIKDTHFKNISNNSIVDNCIADYENRSDLFRKNRSWFYYVLNYKHAHIIPKK